MKKTSNILWGLFFVLAGAVVIANQMGFLVEISLFNLIFLILVIPIFGVSLYKLNWCGILFSGALTIIVFDSYFGLESITPWPVLIAALLGSIGLSLIFKKKNSCVGALTFGLDEFDEVVDVDDDELVSYNVKLGSGIKYVNSKNLKKANISCSLGAMTVYFDNTILSKDGAILNINASLSGVTLFIPKEWEVILSCDTSAGGIEEKNGKRKSEAGAPKLTIVGSVSLSGVEIIYV